MIEGFKPAEFDKSSDTLEKQINKMKQEKGTKDMLNLRIFLNSMNTKIKY